MWAPLLVWCSIGKNCTDIVLPECNSCGIPRSNRGTRIQDRSSHAAGYRISLSSSDSETGLSSCSLLCAYQNGLGAYLVNQFLTINLLQHPDITLDRAQCAWQWNLPYPVPMLNTFQVPLDAERCALPDVGMMRPHPVAHKLDSLTDGSDAGFPIQVQLQHFQQEAFDAVFPNSQFLFAVVQDDDVIHISNVVPYLQDPLAELVQLVQIDVGKHLAEQITYRHSDIVEPLLQRDFLWSCTSRQTERCVRAVDDTVQNGQKPCVFYLSRKDVFQNTMRYPVEILADIKFQIVPRTSVLFTRNLLSPAFQPEHRIEWPSTRYAAIRIFYVSLDQYRIEDPVNSPLDNTMPKLDGHYHPQLRLMDIKNVILFYVVFTAENSPSQLLEIAPCVIIERKHIGLIPTTLGGFLQCVIHILHRKYRIIDILYFHCYPLSSAYHSFCSLLLAVSAVVSCYDLPLQE